MSRDTDESLLEFSVAREEPPESLDDSESLEALVVWLLLLSTDELPPEACEPGDDRLALVPELVPDAEESSDVELRDVPV